jgi:hypothetical protein
MLSTVYFDDQFGRAGNEIANERADGHLSVKANATQLAVADRSPEQAFSVSRVIAQFARTVCWQTIVSLVQPALPFAASQLFPSRLREGA